MGSVKCAEIARRGLLSYNIYYYILKEKNKNQILVLKNIKYLTLGNDMVVTNADWVVTRCDNIGPTVTACDKFRFIVTLCDKW